MVDKKLFCDLIHGNEDENKINNSNQTVEISSNDGAPGLNQNNAVSLEQNKIQTYLLKRISAYFEGFRWV